METLMNYIGELLKPLHIAPVTKDIYRGVLKLIVVLQHDFPEFIAANSSKLCANLPSHCIQLHNLILNASSPFSKPSDPLQPGLKVDRISEIRESPENINDVEAPLRQFGLSDVLDQALQNGPSEDAVAHIARAIQQKSRQSGVGFVPINADLKLIDSIVNYVGMQSIARAAQKQGPIFVSSSPDAALLSMLVHELQPEARYFFINSIVGQLREPNSHTHYFSQALLEIFGSDLDDQEETDIRNQVTRILFERLIAQWPQPWGLIVVIHEIVKNEKYMFFDLPFIKASPEVQQKLPLPTLIYILILPNRSPSVLLSSQADPFKPPSVMLDVIINNKTTILHGALCTILNSILETSLETAMSLRLVSSCYITYTHDTAFSHVHPRIFLCIASDGWVSKIFTSSGGDRAQRISLINASYMINVSSLPFV